MGIQCEVLKVDKHLLLSKVKTFLRNINNELSVEDFAYEVVEDDDNELLKENDE